MLQEEFLEKYDLVDPGLTKYYSIQYNFHHHHIVATTVIHMIFFKVRLSNSESPRTIFALLVCIFKFSSLLKVWRDICRDNVEIMFVCLLCRWKGKLLFVICKLKMFLADQEVETYSEFGKQDSWSICRQWLFYIQTFMFRWHKQLF